MIEGLRRVYFITGAFEGSGTPVILRTADDIAAYIKKHLAGFLLPVERHIPFEMVMYVVRFRTT